MAIRYPDSSLEEVAAGRIRRLRRVLAGLAGLVALVVGISFVLSWDSSEGSPGNLTEPLYEWPGPLPSFTDVTGAWGLNGWRNTAETEASGGMAIGDLNRDGRDDLVVAGGQVAVFLAVDGGFSLADLPPTDGAVSVDLADVDADGLLDLLVGRESDEDLILWGETLLSDQQQRAVFKGGAPTTGLISVDLDEDGLLDIVRLGYGGGRAAADVIWRQVATRVFEEIELPNSRRRSLAAGVADFDGSGSLDLWVTRDVGWKTGGDSLYVGSRSDPLLWEDRATDFGTAVEIDGMGVALADFTGDQQIDVYLSDLGDNELLRREGPFLEPAAANYAKDAERGIGRIRAIGADEGQISSSWGSGVADLNLDGVLDLVVVNGGFPSQKVDNKVPGTTVAISDAPALFLGLPEEPGRWADVWPDLGLEWAGAGRGLVLGDLDGDLDTDIVISTRDNGLVVLRNDTEGPSLLVEVETSCDSTGLFVNLFASAGPLQVPVAAPTFLGRHSRQFILGTGGESVSLPSGDRSRGPARYSFAGKTRERLVLTCRDVGRDLLR